MPELKNTFLQGRMNKDLDDRLVPKGEYRDATNIQISTSEGSDVGAIESILGNTKIANKPGGGSWNNDFGLSNPEAIGVCVDTKNEKIYWFIAADNRASAVMEYNQTTDIVSPVLVDVRTGTNNVLNFSKSNLITGVNIIDGLLFWTDNLNEPCRINIETFKAGSTQTGNTLATTTVLFSKKQNTNVAVALEDITVIKKSPQQAPGFELRSSLIGYFDVPGLGRIPLTTQGYNFRDTNGRLNFDAGQIITFDGTVQQSGIFIGKEIELTTSFRDKKNTIKIYIKATVTATTATQFTITPSIIPSNIPNKLLTYDVRVIEEDYIYKKSFPRFSYRWKYNDGEYSTYAPFTEALFLPGKYNYNGIDAENKAMLNHLRQITLTFPDRETTFGPPRDVESMEVLYKPSNNNNIYVIKTVSFKTGGAGFTRFTFKKELDGPVIESSQMLRLFDAVPKKALAQEIIGNRIVYGNYKEGYDTSSEITILPRVKNDQPPAFANSLTEAIGSYSIKSNREYQIGVAFLDDFGRESPVITDETGAVSLGKENSINVNRIEVSVTSAAPSWAKMYKYYLKNNYSSSYNLMLDRFYDDEDGNVWLSFPSSERNKIDEKDTLILKKKHGDAGALFFDNEYKVIDIKNEPPEYLRINNLKPAARSLVNGADTQMIAVGETLATFEGPSSSLNASFYREIGNARAVQFVGGTALSGKGKSKIYSIKSAGPGYSSVSSGYQTYKLELTEPLEAADTWVSTINHSSTNVEIILYSSDEYFSSEYIGRFFVKVEKLGSFETDIVEPSQNAMKLNTYITERTPVESRVNIGLGTGGGTGLQIYNGFIPTLPQTPLTLTKIDSVNLGGGNFFTQVVDQKRVARIGFNHASNTDDGDTSPDDFTSDPLTDGSNSFTLIYGPITAGINQIQGFTDQLKTGNLIGFGKDGETSNSYVMTEVTDPAEITYSAFRYEYVSVTLDRNYNANADFPVADINALRILEQDLTVPMTDKPAIFEIKAEKNVDIDIYYEASDAFEIADLDKPKTLNYKNCIAFGNGIESTRIGDDFNAPEMGKGVRVSSILLKPIKEEHKASSLIFSGIINSRSGVNDSNQFLIAENITKDLNSIYGSIQKLSARGAGAQGDLLTLCEDKCFRILANKDALFEADGNPQLTAASRVLGQAIPFAGEYGISKNPESFASFGFRSYFTDKARGAIIRLSADGITNIAEKGMSDFFQDKLSTQTGNYIGSYDVNTSAYIIKIGSECYSFKEGVNGWNTRLTYNPEMGASLNNIYYTYKTGEIFKHTDASTRARFYGIAGGTTVTTLINDNPSKIKNFKTVLYEGDTGWECTVSTNENDGFVYTGSKGKWGNIPGTTADARDKEGIYYGWIRGNTLDPVNNTVGEEFAMQGVGTVYSSSTVDDKFSISFGRPINVSLQIGDTVYFINSSNEVQLAGTVFSISTDRTTITVDPGDNGVLPEPPRFVFFVKDNEINTSGLIGYYAELTFSNPLEAKNELFAVGSEIFISS